MVVIGAIEEEFRWRNRRTEVSTRRSDGDIGRVGWPSGGGQTRETKLEF